MTKTTKAPTRPPQILDNIIANKRVFDTPAFLSHLDARIKSKIGIIEATVDYCEKHEVDLMLAAEVIKRHTKYKKLLAEEAGKLSMLK